MQNDEESAYETWFKLDINWDFRIKENKEIIKSDVFFFSLFSSFPHPAASNWAVCEEPAAKDAESSDMKCWMRVKHILSSSPSTLDSTHIIQCKKEIIIVRNKCSRKWYFMWKFLCCSYLAHTWFPLSALGCVEGDSVVHKKVIRGVEWAFCNFPLYFDAIYAPPRTRSFSLAHSPWDFMTFNFFLSLHKMRSKYPPRLFETMKNFFLVQLLHLEVFVTNDY